MPENHDLYIIPDADLIAASKAYLASTEQEADIDDIEIYTQITDILSEE